MKNLLTESYEKIEELEKTFKDANITYGRLQDDMKRFVNSSESQLLGLQYQLLLINPNYDLLM